jgi:hypothetical protein
MAATFWQAEAPIFAALPGPSVAPPLLPGRAQAPAC